MSDVIAGMALAVVLGAGATTVPGVGPLSYVVVAIGCLAGYGGERRPAPAVSSAQP
ncbi:hypothetical protein [Streptosporangium sp. H16]|uniref:hypothetical protein n=1 Tax=Streptosporangium sp. H16 TaxID=3444184 RepID=UPI003F78DCE3